MGSVFESIVLVAGGLGLFLFGMKMMSSGLQTIAGDRLQNILQKATSNRFLAVIVGIAATIALNSSTASTVMTVSFVNSGLMNLTQAIGIIMGANLGTTLSAQLVAFRIDAYAPIFIFVGIILHVFFKKKRVKDIGFVILGFGILFFGITTMGGPLRGLGNLPAFNEMLVAFQNPFLALLAGFAFTAAVQSSTAATGILVAMYISGVPIPFETGAFIILGTNIGTSITTLIASIPANRASKRAALFHITFDIIGSTVFGTLIFIFPGILGWFQAAWAEPARQIAMFHTLYNSATLLLLLPFASYLAKLMERVIPIVQAEITDATYEKKLLYLDTKLLKTPSIAVFNAHRELCRMGKIANDNLALSLESFFEKDTEKANKAFDNEAIVNYLYQEIASKLVWVNNMTLSNADAEKIGKMFRLLSDIERIGDHAENIAEYTIAAKENDLNFSDAAISELKILGETTVKLANEALYAFEHQDASKLAQVKALEEEVDRLTKEFAESHIDRLKTEDCDPKSGVVFTDMIIDLERCGDHANNIAFSILPDAPIKFAKN
ncbi:MAG: Na/Pi cotransporter family protein [Defluviitaleaceae bacterium]|nr:Na/Pi cotransporter family protein [Defluviitaleaceae bacterium]